MIGAEQWSRPRCCPHGSIDRGTYTFPVECKHGAFFLRFHQSYLHDSTWLLYLQHIFAPLRSTWQEAAEVISAGRIAETQAKELFDKVDADKSGVVDYEEFKKVRLGT